MRVAADDNLVADGSLYYGAFGWWSSTDRYATGMIALAFALQTPVVLPRKVAYTEPHAIGSPIRRSASSHETVWYGEAESTGPIKLFYRRKTGYGERVTVQVGKAKRQAVVTNGIASFGSFEVKKGPVRVAVTWEPTPWSLGEGLEATGDVRWNTSERLNAASVHFRWPTEKEADIRWFYNEATMLTDPSWSYTAACGFARGYFGFQVNDPGRRCVIFSVWDAGNEAVDRNKVSDENRVVLIAKGENVVADSFGNEGTGGHSHVDTMWKTGKPLRFLVGCRPEGDKTLYAGYWMGPGDKAWRLVGAFRAPRDGGPLRDLYSFSENYVGDNGQLWRESTFGNGWVGLANGSWKPLTQARFTTDGHGRAARWDYDAFVRKGLFHLRHGGYASGKVKFGDVLTKPEPVARPEFVLPVLP